MKIQSKKRISHKEEFELCYIRHKYLRKIRHNPTVEEMAPYNKIVENFAKNTFNVYKNLFLLVGLDQDDIINVAQIQLVSFLGLFAIERNIKKLADFKRSFRSHNSIICTKNDLLNKNKSSFTCFLKQRLEDVVRVCRQKAKNIKGVQAEEFLVFQGSKKPPNDLEDLLENHSKYGYRPINIPSFKLIRKKIGRNQEGPVYLQNGTWYVCIPLRKKSLSLTDFSCNNYNPYDNIHYKSPEEIFEIRQESNWESKWIQFNSISDNERIEVIKTFIEKNKDKTIFKKEVKFAHKVLESLNDDPNI